MIIWKALIRDELRNVKYRSPDFNKKMDCSKMGKQNN